MPGKKPCIVAGTQSTVCIAKPQYKLLAEMAVFLSIHLVKVASRCKFVLQYLHADERKGKFTIRLQFGCRVARVWRCTVAM